MPPSALHHAAAVGQGHDRRLLLTLRARAHVPAQERQHGGADGEHHEEGDHRPSVGGRRLDANGLDPRRLGLGDTPVMIHGEH